MIKQTNILFTILIAAIFLAGLSFVLPKNDEKYLGDMFWVRKTFAPSKYNVILMGDSRIYRALSPEIMEEELSNLKILNFGYSNGGLNPEMFQAAEEKLAKYSGVKIIVLGITANTLTDYTRDNKQYLQELNRPREEVLERLYLSPVSYWFSATSPEQLKTHFQNKNIPKKSWYISNYRMNGYVESDKFPTDTLEAIPSYTKDFNNFQVDKKHLTDLFNQVKKWTKNGIYVFAYRPPVSQTMLELENNMGKYDENRITSGITKAGGHWVALRNTNFKTYDGSHLDRASAEQLSMTIARKIKAQLEE